MSGSYLDTSAVMKVVRIEAESSALIDHVTSTDPDDLLISELVVTELWRGVQRNVARAQDLIDVLDRFTVLDVTRSAFRTAGQLAGGSLRSLDAIHIAVALEAGAAVLITYDTRQAEAAVLHGLRVVAPS